MRLFLLLSAAALMMGADLPDAVLGRWRTVNVTKGGLGAMYEFKTGGVVLVRPGAIAPGTYRIEGNELVLPPLTEGGPENRQTMDMRVPGQVTCYKGQAKSMEMARVGKTPPGKPTLVGEWVAMREMDGQKMEMRMFFYANGKTLFLLPFQTQQAKYSVENGRMTIALPDGKTAEGPFTGSATALSIPSVRSGTQVKLQRY